MDALPVAALVDHLRRHLPALLAVYGFGSRVPGTAGADRALDLAVLVAGRADVLQLWSLSGDLADLAGCPVDLIDLRAASTVMQYQVITTGQRWWTLDSQAALWEAAVLSDKTELDEARRPLLEDIAREGRIHGR